MTISVLRGAGLEKGGGHLTIKLERILKQCCINHMIKKCNVTEGLNIVMYKSAQSFYVVHEN